jgi:predicted nucleic acid-binding protein
MSVTLDTGALIALERGDARVLALLDRVRSRRGRVLIPAGVVAQAWRSPRQNRIARLLRSAEVEVVALDEPAARAVGLLLGLSKGTDTVDGHVALVARLAGTPVVTSDPGDLTRLDGTLDVRVV